MILSTICCWSLFYVLHVEGLMLILNGSIISNGSHIRITNVGTTENTTLSCMSESFLTGGTWYLHPTQLSTNESDAITPVMVDRGWYTSRSMRLVRLWRDSTNMAEEGIFTCQFMMDKNTFVSVGIYYPIISMSAHIDVVSRTEGTFRVQCTSRGGGTVNMSVTGSDGYNSSLTAIEDSGENSVLRRSLVGTTNIISNRSDGDTYNCTASNTVSTVMDSVKLRVAAAPSLSTLEQLSPTSVRVEWTHPLGGATITHYIVHYNDSSTEKSEYVAVFSNSSSCDITNLINGPNYNIWVEAMSSHLSGVSVVMTITLNRAPTHVVVNETKPTSVLLFWQAVEDANRYCVTLTQTVEDNLCSDSHNVSVNTSSQSVVIGENDKDMLKAYTTYSITVVAMSDVWSGSRESNPIIITTNQTSAAVAPHNVITAAVKSTVISVQWDGLASCTEVNGLIVKYIVEYRAESSDVVQSIFYSGEWNLTGAEVSLTGLTPFTNYSITVAAVNEKGDVGLYSDPITEQTREDIPGPVVIAGVPSLFMITITWDPPERPNGVIIAYEVSYRPADSSVSLTSVNTTDLNITFSTPSNLELGTEFIFTVTAYTQVGPGNTTSIIVSTLPTFSAVQGVAVTSLNSTTVNISWNALVISDIPIDYYIVVYSQSGSRDGEQRAMFNSSTTSGVITNLRPGNMYKFQVFAVVTVGDRILEGERSTPVEVTFAVDNTAHNIDGGLVGGIIVTILIVMAVICIAVPIFCVLKKHCASNQKSPRKHSPATPSVLLTPVYHSTVKDSGEKPTAPLVSMFPEDRHVVEGEEVVFKVKVSGSPQPKITWYHNREVVVSDYAKELAADGSLTFFSAELKHNGVYQLVATNTGGSVDKRVCLFVQEESQQSTHVKKKQISFSPIPMEEFGDYVCKCHANDNEDFKNQYTEINKDGDHPTTIGLSRPLKKFNRFANITVYDDNRIVLRPIEGHVNCQRDFINACCVDGYQAARKFIATQGPLPKTTVDFWRLVWQEKPHIIAMVTNLEEGTKKKCHQYWPDTDTQSFGPFQVKITSQQILADYTTRNLSVQLTGSSEQSLKVTQFHFTAWPDHGVPDYATPLLSFHKKLKIRHKYSDGPMLVHCSAGVGRTGTLITIDRVLDQLQQERVVDIAGTIRDLRNQRMKMVQHVEQYIFIHDAILEAVTCGDTQINASDLRKSIHQLRHRDPTINLTGYESQFKILEKVSPNPREILQKKALENPTKNRTDDFLPGDRWRVLLWGDTEDYIHAVAVNGYKQKKAFIIAQSPMQSTARDFWKMIIDRKCGVIVMLCDLVEAGQEVCHQYWPTTGVVEIGEFIVYLVGNEKYNGFIVRTISIQHKQVMRKFLFDSAMI